MGGGDRGRARLRPQWRGTYDRVLALLPAERLREDADHGHLRAGLVGLLAWADGQGLEPDIDYLLDPAVIDWYARSELTAPAYRRKVREALYELARVIHGPAAVPDGVPGQQRGPRITNDPYTDAETDALLVWADSQRTDRLRRGLLAILGTGLGAGIRTGELVRLTGRDVRGAPGALGVAVTSGGPVRFVPVLARYEDLLRDLAARAGDGWLVCPDAASRTRQTVTNLRQQAPPPPRPTPPLVPIRCRNTWIAHHLDSGTRLDVLLAAAGAASVEILVNHSPD